MPITDTENNNASLLGDREWSVGKSCEDVMLEARHLREADFGWSSRRSGQFSNWAQAATAIEDGGVLEIAKEASSLFLGDSQFYADRQPSLKFFQEFVVSTAASLVAPADTVCGSVTMGGTESNILAVKAARDFARATKPWIKQPEILLPYTAHPSFLKAADYFSLKPVRVPPGPDLRTDPSAIADKVSDQTIMIIGSAPEYCYGMFDDIPAFSDIAEKHDLWLHIDACVGGFIGPFMAKRGFPLPPFDFSISGVTSMSVDAHKHAYAPMGVSVLLHRNEEYRSYQEWVFDDWPAGRLWSPIINSGRPASVLAGAWAVIRHLGQDGYSVLADKMIARREQFLSGLAEIRNIDVLGAPDMMILSYGSTALDAFAIADGMEAAGWRINRVKDPSGAHVIIDPFDDDTLIPDYMSDLSKVTKQVETNKITSTNRVVSYN